MGRSGVRGRPERGRETEPAALAGFYRRRFGMEDLGASDAGDVSLTDGGFNLTLFKHRPQLHEPCMELGLHHLGIAVDDLDKTLARYHAFNPRGVGHRRGR